jgi:hypothetical protein
MTTHKPLAGEGPLFSCINEPLSWLYGSFAGLPVSALAAIGVPTDLAAPSTSVTELLPVFAIQKFPD